MGTGSELTFKNEKMRRLFWILLAFVFVVSGCKKLDDNYRQFVGDGEIKYVGKADSLHIRGGDQRAELSWLLMSDPSVSSYKIYWNNRQDSLSGELTKTENVDTVKVIIDNLTEETHEFQVFLFDNEGRTSVLSSIVARVYGPRYRGSLLNRLIGNSKVLRGDQLELTMGLAEETLLYSEVRYLDINDELTSHRIIPNVEIDTLLNFPNGGSYEMRSAFKPDSLALDTFYTDFELFETEEFAFVENPLELSFKTRMVYGTQDNQLAILVSTDFNGVYEKEDINAATWTDITEEFTLSSGGDDFTTSGIKELEAYMEPNKPIYIAFRYTYLPDAGNPRNWMIEDVLVKTVLNGMELGIEGKDVNIVVVGETDRDVAVLGSSGRITFRGNTGLRDQSLVTWGISGPLN